MSLGRLQTEAAGVSLGAFWALRPVVWSGAGVTCGLRIARPSHELLWSRGGERWRGGSGVKVRQSPMEESLHRDLDRIKASTVARWIAYHLPDA